jgi:hypothetical protein
MINLLFTYIWLFYIGLTESIVMQFAAILIFYVASRIAYAPTDNWYYPKQED